MIKMTDNLCEARKFALSDLVKMGYKYIARDKGGTIYAFSSKPIRRETVWVVDIPPHAVDKLKDISLVSRIFPDIEWENVEPFRIPYTDWKEVPVDTPVLYINNNGKIVVRYFCKYDEKNDRVLMYMNGRTSLTGQETMEAYPGRVTIYEQGEK